MFTHAVASCVIVASSSTLDMFYKEIPKAQLALGQHFDLLLCLVDSVHLQIDLSTQCHPKHQPCWNLSPGCYSYISSVVPACSAFNAST